MKTTLTRCLAGGLALTLAACGTVAGDDGDVVTTDRPAAEMAVADFTLEDTNGDEHTLSDYLADGKTVVLEWFNPDCPYVVAWHGGETDRMAGVFGDVRDEDLVWLAINSGAEGKQGAGLERNKKAVADWKMPYPVLMDMSGETGMAYGAKTTPHMFIITPDGELAYEGAIDDSGGRGESKVNFVAQALGELREGKDVSVPKTKSYGCSVKYAKK